MCNIYQNKAFIYIYRKKSLSYKCMAFIGAHWPSCGVICTEPSHASNERRIPVLNPAQTDGCKQHIKHHKIYIHIIFIQTDIKVIKYIYGSPLLGREIQHITYSIDKWKRDRSFPAIKAWISIHKCHDVWWTSSYKGELVACAAYVNQQWRLIKRSFGNNIQLNIYSALSIYHGQLSPNNSRGTPIARPLGRGMGVFREILVWPKFYIWIQCTAYCIMTYGTAIYRESIVSCNDFLVRK